MTSSEQSHCSDDFVLNKLVLFEKLRLLTDSGNMFVGWVRQKS